MSPTALSHFCALLKSRSGIDLGGEKDYLVHSRLGPLASAKGFPDAAALLEAIRARPCEPLIEAAIDALTTNETFFFRDQTPFDHLRRIWLERAKGGPRRFRIWSAACSTGQEPYSIAMLWAETADQLAGSTLEIAATDLSTTCLAKARAGVYSAFEAQRGLTDPRLARHFEQFNGGWHVKPEVSKVIVWGRHNLLDRPDQLGVFDLVFCRNVLIYFDRATRAKVLEAIAGRLTAGGHLILGASETLLGVTDAFVAKPGAPGLYIKSETPAPSARALA